MTIKLKLLACISLLIAVLASISMFSFYAMDEQSRLANTIVADRVVPMEQLKRIADGYAVAIVDTVHKTRSGVLTPAEGLASVDKALVDIQTNWDAYIATTLTTEEKQIADHFDANRKQANVGVDTLRAILASNDAATLAAFADHKLYPTIDPLGTDVASLMELQIRVAKENLAEGNHIKDLLTVVMIVLSVVGAGLAAFSVWTIIFSVIRPINSMTAAMSQLAGGNLKVSIFGEGRADEIGRMASTVAVFRNNARERVRLEAEADANRTTSERERREREQEQAADAADVRHAVENLGRALGALSDGRLNYRIDEVFAARLDKVRVDFNGAVEKLEDAMRDVGENAQAIAAGAGQIRSAADDLSKRTEQQAASVEETAAALEQITTTVTDSSRRAEEAGRQVEDTRQSAERSGEIVGRAVGAMQEIETSSRAISNIIGVIDEIAFQTNLLALNAGVEAARAGESGKGFAVVAQEVRELAQRSASAAKEIKTLISKSGQQVQNGVELVSQAGEALQHIVSQVQSVSVNVNAIVEGAKEQAVGLKEINLAVNSLDQGTQQNAAMVEESTAASHSLAKEADALFQLTSRFEISSAAGTAPNRGHGTTVRARGARPAPAAQSAPRAAMMHGNAALQTQSWDDF